MPHFVWQTDAEGRPEYASAQGDDKIAWYENCTRCVVGGLQSDPVVPIIVPLPPAPPVPFEKTREVTIMNERLPFRLAFVSRRKALPGI